MRGLLTSVEILRLRRRVEALIGDGFGPGDADRKARREIARDRNAKKRLAAAGGDWREKIRTRRFER